MHRYIYVYVLQHHFKESSEHAAEAAALVPLAAVAAYVTHVEMALALLPAVSGTLQKKKKEEGKKITEAVVALGFSIEETHPLTF